MNTITLRRPDGTILAADVKVSKAFTMYDTTFAVHRTPGAEKTSFCSWTVTEVTTGAKIMQGRTMAEAKERSIELIERYKDQLGTAIRRTKRIIARGARKEIKDGAEAWWAAYARGEK